MSVSWYYVRGSERVGPISEAQLKELIKDNEINRETYVWKKGLLNWERMKDIEELAPFLELQNLKEEVDQIKIQLEEVDSEDSLEQELQNEEENQEEDDEGHLEEEIDLKTEEIKEMKIDKKFNWDEIDQTKSLFTLRTSYDSESEDSFYGPFSFSQLKILLEDGRITSKTLIFTPGMSTWDFIADIPFMKNLGHLPSIQISDDERERLKNRPFLAKVEFLDLSQIYEGVCRDISRGGMQVLVGDFKGKKGDEVRVKIYPPKQQQGIEISAVIGRLLEGKAGAFLRFIDPSSNAIDAIESYINGSDS